MATVNPRIGPRVTRLMERASRAMGLRLSFHDRLHRSGLPEVWRIHHTQPCMQAKRVDVRRCAAFDGAEVHRALAGKPEGRIHTCPAGCTEIAVPVDSEGLYGGVLFAGQCWMGKGDPPYPGMIRPKAWGWLEDRRTVLRAVATELGRLLAGDRAYLPKDRRREVLEYLQAAMERPVSARDLAEALSLSVSRTGHLVKELFGLSLPALVRTVKLKEGAHILSSTGLPIGEVARLVGYEDANYFTRLFKKQYRLSPREYRRRYPAEA